MVAALGSPVDAAVRTSLKYPGPALAQHLVDHFRLFLAFEWSPGQAECMEDINPDGRSKLDSQDSISRGAKRTRNGVWGRPCTVPVVYWLALSTLSSASFCLVT